MAWRVLFGEVKSADNEMFKAFKKIWITFDLSKINTLTIDPSCNQAPWLKVYILPGSSVPVLTHAHVFCHWQRRKNRLLVLMFTSPVTVATNFPI